MTDSDRQQMQTEGQEEPPITERGLGRFIAAKDTPLDAYAVETSHQPLLTIPTGSMRFITIQYWQQYFRISQHEVLVRIMHSIKPLKPEFLRISKSNPDLYGPFWIMTTIVVLASLSGNLSRYFRNWDQSEFEFRMELVRYAVFVLYGYGVLFAGAVGVILNFFGSQLTPINIICLYGYSLSTFLGICLLCIIPSPVLHWLLIVYGTLNSTALILANLHGEADKMQKRNRTIFYSTVAIGQLAFMLIFKNSFYDLSYKL